MSDNTQQTWDDQLDIRRQKAMELYGNLQDHIWDWLPHIENANVSRKNRRDRSRYHRVFSGLCTTDHEGELAYFECEFDADLEENLLTIIFRCGSHTTRILIAEKLQNTWGGDVHNFLNGYVEAAYKITRD